MEFLPTKTNSNGPVECVRVNWLYRPRDIQRNTGDMRLVFASMHSDTCPLSSLRGKCRILHRSEVDNLEEYKKAKDSFYFEKMYDRYIMRYYDVVPTKEVINVPPHVKKVLDERWKFVLVEMGRRGELTRASKSCKRCTGFAGSYVALIVFPSVRVYFLLLTPCLEAIPWIAPCVKTPTTCNACDRHFSRNLPEDSHGLAPRVVVLKRESWRPETLQSSELRQQMLIMNTKYMRRRKKTEYRLQR